jgi:hypothetical protein
MIIKVNYTVSNPIIKITYDETPIYVSTTSNPIYVSVNYGTGGSGTVTSVALTMPSGFVVTGSPITTNGTLLVTGAGTTLQYLRGDGSLATFPSLSGYVPTSRTLTINGTTYDLSADRSWTVDSLPSQATHAGQYLTTDGTTASWASISLTSYVPYTGASTNVNLGTNNIYANAFYNAFTNITASGTQVVLTVNSAPEILVSGSGGQTIKLPNATTLSSGTTYSINNNQSSGAVSVNNNSNTLVVSIPSGGYAEVILIDNTTAAGTWDRHFQAPANVSWSTNTFDYVGSITGATWNGLTVQPNRGGTGQSTYTDGQLLIGNSTGNTLSKSTLSAGTGISITNGSGTITITNTSPSSGGTVTSVAALTLGTTGTDLSSSVATGTTTPVITLQVPTASATNRGALSSADWTTFNGKQGTITLTTTGTSGAATLISNTLNIPQYSGTNIYNADGTLASARSITHGGFNLSLIGSSYTNRFTSAGRLLLGTTTENSYLLDVNGNTNIGGTLYVTYPNSSRPSINFAAGGTLRAFPLTGDMEMDGTGKLYFTHNDTERGIIPAYQFFKSLSVITLTSTTSAQPIFNTITNGAVTLKGATNYVFEMLLYITGMSTTSGTFGITFGGAATIATIAWQTLGSKVTNIATTASHQSTFNITSSNATLVTASAFANGYMRVWGNVRIGTGGTFIPQITLGVAAAASIQPQSYFRITALSANSVDYIGNWS